MSVPSASEGKEALQGPAPLVSVILCTKDRPEFLDIALRGLRRQTFKDFETIVVNDGGREPLDVLRRFSGDLRIVFVSHTTSRGISGARNTGLRAARGRYVNYLDDDDFFYENHLELLLAALRDSGAAVGYSDGIVSLDRLEEGHWVSHARRIEFSYDFAPEGFLTANRTPLLAVMHERACLDVAGPFWESLHFHEDWELWQRLSRYYDFAHLAEPTCEYTRRFGGQSLSRNLAGMEETWLHVRALGELRGKTPRVVELAERAGRAGLVAESPAEIYALSVIVHVEAGENPLPCLEALSRALPETGVETLVIADGVPALAGRLSSMLSGDVAIVEHPLRVGRVLACNHAARRAKGGKLLFLSPRVMLHRDALGEMLAQGRAIVGPALCKGGSEDEAVFGGAMDRTSGRLRCIRAAGEASPRERMAVDCVQGDCMLVPRDIFLALGGFGLRYILGCFEDADFCLRAMRDKGIPTVAAIRARARWTALERTKAVPPEAVLNARVFAETWGEFPAMLLEGAEWAVPLSAGYGFTLPAIVSPYGTEKVVSLG